MHLAGIEIGPAGFRFADHPAITDHSIIDERSAAFFALGLARASGRPVALLCTSGTAAANYFPAICEAAQDNVPLLILTGDRPPEDHECGAQQVMQQAGMYGDHVRWHHQTAQPEATNHKLAYLRSLACRALHRSRFPQPGPVHIDLPFRKPLEPVQVSPEHPDHVPCSTLAQADAVIRGRADGAPWVRINSPKHVPDDGAVERLADAVDRSRRPLVVVGTDSTGTRYRRALRDFAERAGIPVFAEPASGLRHWRGRGPNVTGAGDLIAGGALHARHGLPDLVIRIGSAPLTWAMQTLLSDCRDAVHLAVGAGHVLVDPEHVVHEQMIAEPAALFDWRADAQPRPMPPGGPGWRRIRHPRKAPSKRFAPDLPRSKNFRRRECGTHWGRSLPDGCGLYFSSSMLVRHLDTFMCAHARDLDVHFNRGSTASTAWSRPASGIAAARGRSKQKRLAHRPCHRRCRAQA